MIHMSTNGLGNFMDKIDLILWVMSGGFAISFAMILVLYKEIKEMKRDIHELDKRLYGIETMLHMKDCCILKSEQHIKKAE